MEILFNIVTAPLVVALLIGMIFLFGKIFGFF